METQYKATAQMKNGETVEVNGTIQQVSNWADNIIRSGDVNEIRIAEVKQ